MPYQTLDAEGLRNGQTVYSRRECVACCEDFDYDYEGGYCGECGDYHCGSCDMCRSECGNCGYYGDECVCNEYSSHVRNYSYRPSPYRPKGDYRNGGEALLGVELEVGGSASQIVPVVLNYDSDANHLYMKEDGSIDGVEIVTHPMTLTWSQTFPFADMVADLRGNGAYVDEGYGLHVHVSRNAFRTHGRKSATHQLAWLLFLYRNSSPISTLARRVSDEWASFRTPQRGEMKRKAQSHDGDRSERYVAVNCNNDRTYELRFFAATLDPQEFLAAMQFADASVEYTRNVKTADVLTGRALTWGDFRDWASTRPQYSELSAEIVRLCGDSDGDKFSRPNGRIAPVIPARRTVSFDPYAPQEYDGGTTLARALSDAGDRGIIRCLAGPMDYRVRVITADCGCCETYQMRNTNPDEAFGDDYHDVSIFRTDRVWRVMASTHSDPFGELF